MNRKNNYFKIIFAVMLTCLFLISCGNIIEVNEYNASKEVNANIDSILENDSDELIEENVADGYLFIRDFAEGFAAVGIGCWTTGVLMGFVDESGAEVITPQFDMARDFSEGLARVQLDGEWGFVDTTGEVVIPFQFDFVEDFSEGLAAFNRGGDTSWWLEGGKWGFIDRTGREIIPPIFEHLYQRPTDDGTGERTGFRYGRAIVGMGDTETGIKWGVIDQSGDLVVSFIYNHARPFSEGLAVVGLGEIWRDAVFGYIDTSGNVVIPIKYTSACNFANGVAKVSTSTWDFDRGWRYNLQFGFIDRYGNEVVPISFYEMHWFYYQAQDGRFIEGLEPVGNFIKVQESYFGGYRDFPHTKWGLVDRTGHVVVPLIYDGIGRFSEGLISVNLGGEITFAEWALIPTGGKWGFIDTSGTVVVPIEYEWVWSFSEGRAAVFGEWDTERRAGFVDRYGNEVIPLVFDRVTDFVNGMAAVAKGEWNNLSWGIIDRYGNEIKPISSNYREIRIFSNGLIAVDTGVDGGRGANWRFIELPE